MAEAKTTIGMTSRITLGVILAGIGFFASVAGYGAALRSDIANLAEAVGRVERAVDKVTETVVRNDRDQAVLRAELIELRNRIAAHDKRLEALERIGR